MNHDWLDLIGFVMGIIFCFMIIQMWFVSASSNYAVIIYTNKKGEFMIEVILFIYQLIFLIYLLLRKIGDLSK